jgi:DNA-binding transcriptional LysR family regulator
MNVHHLELFYYVAKHGGVSAAARHMPYGIQQPAISAQVLQLEDSLGVTLFQRRPFELTREGRRLFEFVEPFFAKLPDLALELRGGADNRLRIATPELVQRDYLPVLFARMKKRVQGFHFTLAAGRVDQVTAQLRSGEIDIGMATLMGRVPEGLRSRTMLSLQMVVVVPEKSRIRTQEDLFKMDRVGEALISLPSSEPMCRLFQDELRRRKVDWFTSLEVSSLDLVDRYVAEGFGWGLSLALPGGSAVKGVRRIPLDFPSVEFAALWVGRLTPLAEIFLEEAQGIVAEQMG